MPVRSQFQSRPLAVQAKPLPQQQETPDLQAQLERAERFGHNFANISIFPPGTPAPEPPRTPLIQPKLWIGQPGDNSERKKVPVIAEIVSRINAPAPEPSAQGQTVQRELEEHDKPVQPIQLASVADVIQPTFYQQVQQEMSDARWEGLGIDPLRSARELLSETFAQEVGNAEAIYIHRHAITKDDVDLVANNAERIQHLNPDARDFSGKVYKYTPTNGSPQFHIVGLTGEDWYRQTLYMLAVLKVPEDKIREEGQFNPQALVANELAETLQNNSFDTVSICSIGSVEKAIKQVMKQREEVQHKQRIIEQIHQELIRLNALNAETLVNEMNTKLAKFSAKFASKLQLLNDIISNNSEAKVQLELICQQEELRKSPIASEIATGGNLARVQECIERLQQIQSQHNEPIAQFAAIEGDNIFNFGKIRSLIEKGKSVTEPKFKPTTVKRNVLGHHIVDIYDKKHLLISIAGAHGEMAGHVIQYVLQNQPQIKGVNLYGSAGSLTEEFLPNTLIRPQGKVTSLEADRQPVPLKNSAQLVTAQEVNHGNVSTLLREHQANVEYLQELGVQTLDMEGYHIASAVNEAAKRGQAVILKIVLRVSDVVTSAELGAQRDRSEDNELDISGDISGSLQQMVIDFGLVPPPPLATQDR